MSSLPPFAAIVLAGGRASRLGGQPKPQLEVGGRSMLTAGLAAVGDAEVVAVLAADLPFVTAAVVTGLRERLTGDGVLVVDDTGRDQLLLGVWRTQTLRAATAGARPHAPLRSVLAPLAVRRYRPAGTPGRPPP